jgi:phosphoribosylaminoimidazole-succinocarboxamide synthase
MLHDAASGPVHTTRLKGLKKLHTGKVRDIYEVDAGSMLIVTTDRLSAFDVVLPDPIPDKGRVLNSISNFWFARTTHIVPNHLTGRSIDEVVSDPAERALLADRAVIVQRLCRAAGGRGAGYVIGSGWDCQSQRDLRYQTTRRTAAEAQSCHRHCSRRR